MTTVHAMVKGPAVIAEGGEYYAPSRVVDLTPRGNAWIANINPFSEEATARLKNPDLPRAAKTYRDDLLELFALARDAGYGICPDVRGELP